MTQDASQGEGKRSLLARLPISEFGRGVILGLLLAAMAVGYMAAGGLSQNPVKVIDALLKAGAPVDERVQRLAPAVRRSLLCTALAVVMEARGEPNEGQIAVAWVVRTRSKERDLSPCDVVFEAHGRVAQFSWASHSIARIVRVAINNNETFLEAQDYAWRVLVNGEPDPVAGANHFWSPANMAGEPAWAKAAAPGSRRRIGGHVFIRIPNRRSLLFFKAAHGDGR